VYQLFLLAFDKQDLILGIAKYSYFGVFAVLVACGLGLPIPEEVALIGGGYAVYQNGWGIEGVVKMITVAMAGVLVGDLMLWRIGWKVGDHPEKVPIIGSHLHPARMEQARELFRKHGAKAVFFGRFLFGIRAVTFFVAGSMRVPLRTFVLMDGLAGLISVPISVYLAWYFGAKLESALEWVKHGNHIILAVVGLLALIVIVTLIRKRGDKKAEQAVSARLQRQAAEAEAKATTRDTES
jgi:membrane protein DedA with SNARE-associated domain